MSKAYEIKDTAKVATLGSEADVVYDADTWEQAMRSARALIKAGSITGASVYRDGKLAATLVDWGYGGEVC